jgi:hypothetical protein
MKPMVQGLLVAALILVVGNGRAEACQCADRPTRELRDRSAAVFRGVVTKIAQLKEPSPTNPGHTRLGIVLTFRVRESLKGSFDRYVVVRSGECDAPPGMLCGDSCTANLDLDEEYLVFATTTQQRFTMSQCGAHSGEAARRRLRELRAWPSSQAPQNNALERTRRVGVPASRAVVRVSPRRSTRCSTGTGTGRPL